MTKYFIIINDTSIQAANSCASFPTGRETEGFSNLEWRRFGWNIATWI